MWEALWGGPGGPIIMAYITTFLAEKKCGCVGHNSFGSINNLLIVPCIGLKGLFDIL